MLVICPAAAPPSTMIRREVRESNTAVGLRYAATGVDDFTGTDHPPLNGSAFAYERLILPELSA